MLCACRGRTARRTGCWCWLPLGLASLLASPISGGAAFTASQSFIMPKASLSHRNLPLGFSYRRSCFKHSIFVSSQASAQSMRMTVGRAWAGQQHFHVGGSKPKFIPFRHADSIIAGPLSRAGTPSPAALTDCTEPDQLQASRRLCVAPMMDWTDRFDRFFLRLFSKHTWLYTEMITANALIHGDRDRHLRFHAAEHPIAVQLGGSEPGDLALCAKMCADYGYDEINLNVGCPSERVSSGSFGACLMAEPALVAECLSAMAAAAPQLPVTIKHRIGIDDQDSYDHLYRFVDAVQSQSPARTFIVHARTAILKGLSPKQNREIPPLRYEFVHQLKRDFPHLEVLINGGIDDLTHAADHLDLVDGVMIGRAAYNTPFQVLATADRDIYGACTPPKTRQQIVEEMLPFIETELAAGTSLNSMTRHMLGLFHGCQGGRAFRRHLSDNVHRPGSGIHTLLEAVEKVPREVRLGLSPANPKPPLPAVEGN